VAKHPGARGPVRFSAGTYFSPKHWLCVYECIRLSEKRGGLRPNVPISLGAVFDKLFFQRQHGAHVAWEKHFVGKTSQAKWFGRGPPKDPPRALYITYIIVHNQRGAPLVYYTRTTQSHAFGRCTKQLSHASSDDDFGLRKIIYNSDGPVFCKVGANTHLSSSQILPPGRFSFYAPHVTDHEVRRRPVFRFNPYPCWVTVLIECQISRS
jgi:hypothetical protein